MNEIAQGHFGVTDVDKYLCFCLWVLHELHDGRRINFIDFDEDAASKLPLEWLNSRGKEKDLLEGT